MSESNAAASPEAPMRRSSFKGLLTLIFFSVVIFGGLFFLFGVIVPPGYIGIKQIFYGPGEGYSNNGLKPGLHIKIPFYSDIHPIPTTVQILNLNREEGTVLENVKTRDGALVDVDITVLTRIYPNRKEGEHGGPADLIQKLDVSPQKWTVQIRNVVERNLRSELSKLSASSFYDPEERYAHLKDATQLIRDDLKDFGIAVDDVLLRRYTYKSQRLDDAIFQKNLQDQEVRLNEAASKLAEAKAKVEQVAAEWDAKIQTLTVKGDNESRVIRSEADLYENQKKAQADLEVAKAVAEVDKKKAEVFAMTSGSDVYVARKAVPYLETLKGGVVSNVDPFSLDEWTKKLGAK
jgi:regulator of protease activity HflC (stomatin/prohibitin superfamily)